MGNAVPLPPLHALSILLVLAGCTAHQTPDDADSLGEAAQAIQGGYTDLQDRAVVGVAVSDGNGRIIRTCSGSLIAPNLVLTAQHCVASTPKIVHCERSLFGATAPVDRVRITPSPSLWVSDAEWIPVAEILLSPGESIVCGRDVALLQLGAKIPAAEAIPLEPRLDEMAEPGEAYSAIGFGASGLDMNDVGLRRRRDKLQIVCVGESCGASNQIDGREWRGDHGICSGDSGGPAIDDAGRVIGVTSRGPTGCDDPIYGGLTGFKDWVRSEATRAARAGHYTAAAWTLGEGQSRPPTEPNGDGTWSSCAASAGTSGSGGGALIALTAVAMLAIRRRAA